MSQPPIPNGARHILFKARFAVPGRSLEVTATTPPTGGIEIDAALKDPLPLHCLGCGDRLIAESATAYRCAKCRARFRFDLGTLAPAPPSVPR